MNLPAGSFQIVITDPMDFGYIAVTDKLSLFIIMSRRKRHDPVRKPCQIFGFTGKYDRMIFIISIIQWADSNGISCCDKLPCFPVVKDAGKFGIQHGKHICAVFPIHWQQNFTIRIAFKRIFY